MPKWIDALLHADLAMTAYAREHEKAKLEVYYYGQKNGVVRKVLNAMPIETQEFYCKDAEED